MILRNIKIIFPSAALLFFTACNNDPMPGANKPITPKDTISMKTLVNAYYVEALNGVDGADHKVVDSIDVLSYDVINTELIKARLKMKETIHPRARKTGPSPDCFSEETIQWTFQKKDSVWKGVPDNYGMR
jgi:hypothetical protein